MTDLRDEFGELARRLSLLSAQVAREGGYDRTHVLIGRQLDQMVTSLSVAAALLSYVED